MTAAVDRKVLQKLAIDQFIGMLAGIDSQAPYGRFMLQHGTYHEAAPKPSRLKPLMPTRCFSNAQRAVVAAVSAGRMPLTYVEGYACSGNLAVCLPIHHAWLIDDEGRVVDQTWESPETSVYFGVAFSARYVMEIADRYSRMYQSLLDDRRDRWRLLNDPAVAAEAVIDPTSIPRVPSVMA
jgi:hypothetical protein